MAASASAPPCRAGSPQLPIELKLTTCATSKLIWARTEGPALGQSSWRVKISMAIGKRDFSHLNLAQRRGGGGREGGTSWHQVGHLQRLHLLQAGGEGEGEEKTHPRRSHTKGGGFKSAVVRFCLSYRWGWGKGGQREREEPHAALLAAASEADFWAQERGRWEGATARGGRGSLQCG